MIEPTCPADVRVQPGVVETVAVVSSGVASSQALSAQRQEQAHRFIVEHGAQVLDGHEVRAGERL